jgi:protein tyrosine/serine phosphatase
MRRCFLLVLVLGFLLSGNGLPWAGEERPESWATPIDEPPGLSNLFKVSDELYRGAQPKEAGYAELKKLGVKTVVSLRTFHSDRSDRKACRKHGLSYVNITVQAWEPEDEEVIEFLEVVTNPENQPVFVHCKHGSDRTGMMSAIYRITVQGWSKEEAIKEMTKGGFGFHSVWQNLVDYVNDLDVEEIKRRAGIA